MIQAANSFPPVLQASSQLFRFENPPHQGSHRFLRFPLNTEINGLLPLADLRGLINVTLTEILPVPQVGEFLLGIMNWRGEAIWILDLAGLLGAMHWCRREAVPASGMAILIQVENQTVGLLVEQVSTIETYDPEERLSVSESMLPAQLQSFLQGYFVDLQGRPLMLLDTHAVIQALKT